MRAKTCCLFWLFMTEGQQSGTHETAARSVEDLRDYEAPLPSASSPESWQLRRVGPVQGHEFPAAAVESLAFWKQNAM